jgi:AcrR family transcriptional regulator
VTSDIIATDGVDNVRIPYVAAAAGVTRPVVYKFFPNRHELIKGVLEDFREDYTRRVPNVTDPNQGLDIATTARAFIDAACDTIEARGSGGWQLLRSVNSCVRLVPTKKLRRSARNSVGSSCSPGWPRSACSRAWTKPKRWRSPT